MFSLRTVTSRTLVQCHKFRPLPCNAAVRGLSSPSAVEPEKTEYVHPLSQIVLEHLQNDKSDWIIRMGLDRGLTFHRDGTFVIKFPSYNEDRSKIW